MEKKLDYIYGCLGVRFDDKVEEGRMSLYFISTNEPKYLTSLIGVQSILGVRSYDQWSALNEHEKDIDIPKEDWTGIKDYVKMIDEQENNNGTN